MSLLRQSFLSSVRKNISVFLLMSLLSGTLAAQEAKPSQEVVSIPGMKYPLAVVAAEKSIYIADRKLPGIWKMSGEKTEIHFQGSPRFRTPLNAVRCLALDSKGVLYAGDSSTREIYSLKDPEKPEPLTNGAIGIPVAMAFDSKDVLFVADLETQRIWKFPATGGQPEEVAVIPAPRGIAIDAKDRLWVVSHGKNQLLRLSHDGKQKEVIVKGHPWKFPHQLVLKDDQSAYVVDGYGKTVWSVSENGTSKSFVKDTRFKNPTCVALQKKNLLIVDPQANSLFSVDETNKVRVLFQGKAKSTKRSSE